MKFRKLSSESDVRFKWPNADREPYTSVDHYEVEDGATQTGLSIMYGWRDAFGANRRRVMVCLTKPNWPAVELVGSDAYDRDKSMLWSAKKAGGNKHYTKTEDPRDHFAGQRLVIHKDYISGKGARTGWAVMISEDDVESMLKLGLTRARDRGWL